MSIELIPEFKINDISKIKLTQFFSKVADDDYKKTPSPF